MKEDAEDYPPDYAQTYTVTVIWHRETGQLLSQVWKDEQGIELKTHDTFITPSLGAAAKPPTVDIEAYMVTVERFGDTHAVMRQTWRNMEGQKHRTHELPAQIEYHEGCGTVCKLTHFTNGLQDRKDGPSEIKVSPQGVVYTEYWKHDGEWKANGVCGIERDIDTGIVKSKLFYKNNRLIAVGVGGLDGQGFENHL